MSHSWVGRAIIASFKALTNTMTEESVLSDSISGKKKPPQDSEADNSHDNFFH